MHLYGWGVAGPDLAKGAAVNVPRYFPSLVDMKVALVACGVKVTMLVSSEGFLYSYGTGPALGVGTGTNGTSQTPALVTFPTKVRITKVAVSTHVLACTDDGSVFSWGPCLFGVLGHGDDVSRDTPKRIDTLMEVCHVSCGEAYSGVVTTDHKVLTWGKGSLGRLGHGDRDNQCTPKLVAKLTGVKAIQIACGYGDAHTLVLTQDGKVYSFGDPDFGKLGRTGASDQPLLIKSPVPDPKFFITKICVGHQCSALLSRDGQVFTFGQANKGQLGHGISDVNHSSTPEPRVVLAFLGVTIKDVELGRHYGCAVSDAGDMYTWGESMLALPTVLPTIITELSGKGISSVACGHAQVICWNDPSAPAARPAAFHVTSTLPTASALGDLLLYLQQEVLSPDVYNAIVPTLNILHAFFRVEDSPAKSPESADRIAAVFFPLKAVILEWACTPLVLPSVDPIPLLVAARNVLLAGWACFQPTIAEREQILAGKLLIV